VVRLCFQDRGGLYDVEDNRRNVAVLVPTGARGVRAVLRRSGKAGAATGPKEILHQREQKTVSRRN
jgi:hypothetical protein